LRVTKWAFSSAVIGHHDAGIADLDFRMSNLASGRIQFKRFRRAKGAPVSPLVVIVESYGLK